MGMMQKTDAPQKASGTIKWFDSVKGFGFVVDDEGGTDVLLHANVLRTFGRSSIADGARVTMVTQNTERGRQAVEILNVETAATGNDGTDDHPAIDMPAVGDAPLQAARVKWFDKVKGFGFANVFGDSEDVFVHIEVLRQFGLAELQSGEAIAIKVVTGPRGKMAAEIRVWSDV